jgi:hypothetical protein
MISICQGTLFPNKPKYRIILVIYFIYFHMLYPYPHEVSIQTTFFYRFLVRHTVTPKKHPVDPRETVAGRLRWSNANGSSFLTAWRR